MRPVAVCLASFYIVGLFPPGRPTNSDKGMMKATDGTQNLVRRGSVTRSAAGTVCERQRTVPYRAFLHDSGSYPERDDTRPLGGWVQLDDAYWGGARRGGKRGRGAPGKTPFVAAVELNREGRSVRMRLSGVGAFRSEEIAAWARCHLEPGTVVLSDALGCFGAVRHAGCFHQPFVTGSGPASARHPALTWVNTILGNIKRSLHGTYHHLSFKHLPRYLAEFSYRFNRRFSLSEMFPRLAFVALRTPPMPYRVLKLAENYP